MSKPTGLAARLQERMLSNTKAHQAMTKPTTLDDDARMMPIAVDLLIPGRFQPRFRFVQQSLQELAETIKQDGLIQPIVVRPIADGKYEIIAGERRWRAVKLLGWKFIDCIIRDLDDKQVKVVALQENISREDLTDYEKACAILEMEPEYSSKTELSKALGIGRSDLYRFLSFSTLPPEILADLREDPTLLGRVSADSIRQALAGDDKDRVEAALPSLWKRVKAGKLAQAKIPAEIRKAIKEKSPPAPRRDIVRATRTFGFVERNAKFVHMRLDAEAITPAMQARLEDYLESLIDELTAP